MKLFTNTDKRFSQIGFVKIKEDKYGASYERETKFGYVHSLDLLHKASGKHLIQSYQKEINKDGFNNLVGLTMYEARLAIKKMKEMRFKEIKTV